MMRDILIASLCAPLLMAAAPPSNASQAPAEATLPALPAIGFDADLSLSTIEELTAEAFCPSSEHLAHVAA